MKIPDNINWGVELQKIKGIAKCDDGKWRRRSRTAKPDMFSHFSIDEWVGGFVRIAVDIEKYKGWGWVLTETFCTQEEYMEQRALRALTLAH